MDAIFAALEALKDAASEPARPAAQPQPQGKAAPKVSAPAAPAPAPAATAPHRAAAPRATGLLQGMFEDGNSLLRAVIAAEVLNPPAALREPGLWNQQPNEPSI